MSNLTKKERVYLATEYMRITNTLSLLKKVYIESDTALGFSEWMFDKYLSEPMTKPFKYSIHYNGKDRHTNNLYTLEKWATVCRAKKISHQTYTDVRYTAKLRLYHYLNKKIEQSKKI